MKSAALLAALASAVAAASIARSDASCLTVSGDAAWPAKSEWQKAMPEIETQKPKESWTQPPYRLDATTVAEVIAAINFTRQHNIRLSILNSGHDFVGRNDAPTGLTLSVSGLKGARLLSSFTPAKDGVPSVDSKTALNTLPTQKGQAYLTFGAGYNTRELNSLLAPSNLLTLGAAHGSVSVAGGWGQTAGHAPLSAKYGLGVDQVVEYKVVTADGVLKVANEATNPDLFWALRGGGGGTFGVVVEATIKAHPSQKVAMTQIWINTTDYNDQSSIYPFAAKFMSEFTAWQDKGMGAYYWLYPNAMSIFAFYSNDDASKDWMNEQFKPTMTKISKMKGINSKTMVFVPLEFPNFWAFFKQVWGDMPGKGGEGMPGGMTARMTASPAPPTLSRRHGPGDGAATAARGIVYLDSWLLGKKELQSDKWASVLKAAMPNLPGGNLGGQFIGGGETIKLGNNDPTSVLPAWRQTYLHLILYAYGKPSSLPLRQFAPDMGAYANEAYPRTHQNWQTTYWGKHYPKLAEVKKKYDPTSLFWVTPGIGAEAWTAQPDGRLCRSERSSTNATAAFAPLNDNKNDADPHVIDEIAGSAFPIKYSG
ncbi:FAD-binding domain-containing protein [Tothia fuscella]|uniref:FAD-binding domain-containing protein n=1 Tax=Tothia fuscella TaxID=1048955 RepID=A0A9P4NQR8_9PEZI|nr:FAD-binding domain-containing protein [Tothia fuscella]